MKQRRSRSAAGDLSLGPGVRTLLIGGALVTFACAIAVWVLSTHTERVRWTTIVTSQKPARNPRDQPNGDARLSVTGRRRTVTTGTSHETADAEQPLMLGLLALAGVLILASVFSTRISEFTFMGITIKVRAAIEAAVRDVNEEAQDPGVAAGAVMSLLAELDQRYTNKRDLSEVDVEEVKQQVIEQLGRPEDDVSVTVGPNGIEVAVDTGDSQPRVTTNAQPLLAPDFDRPPAIRIEEAAGSPLGRSLYAVDGRTEAVLAAVSFDLLRMESPRMQLRLVVDAFVTNRDPLRRAGVQAAVPVLFSYLHAISRKLDGDLRVFVRFSIEPVEPLIRTLYELGLRPAQSVDGYGMPVGVYWISDEE